MYFNDPNGIISCHDSLQSGCLSSAGKDSSARREEESRVGREAAQAGGGSQGHDTGGTGGGKGEVADTGGRGPTHACQGTNGWVRGRVKTITS